MRDFVPTPASEEFSSRSSLSPSTTTSSPSPSPFHQQTLGQSSHAQLDSSAMEPHRLPPQPLPVGVLQQDLSYTIQNYRFPDPATTSRLDLDDSDDDDEDGDQESSQIGNGTEDDSFSVAESDQFSITGNGLPPSFTIPLGGMGSTAGGIGMMRRQSESRRSTNSTDTFQTRKTSGATTEDDTELEDGGNPFRLSLGAHAGR
ncbi:hypothetical protein HDU76_012269, partial [Blyttiomyces sp. JEL0837]